MTIRTILVLLCLYSSAFAQFSFSPTTTHNQQTTHNAVACKGFNLSKSWCYALYNSGLGFPGWTNAQTDTADPVITNPVHAIPGNHLFGRGTDADIHSFLPGWDTKILAEDQLWFTAPTSGSPSTTSFDGQTYQTSGSHLMNGVIDGEQSAALETIGSGISQTRANDKVKGWYDFGIDGGHLVINGNPEGCASFTPYVPGSTTFTSDCGNGTARKRAGYAARKILWAMQNYSGGIYSGMKLMLMIEESAWKTGANCDEENDDQILCVQAKLESDFAWYATTFFDEPQYLRKLRGANQQPVVSWFYDPSNFGGSCGDGSACPTLHGSTCNSSSSCDTAILDQLTEKLQGTCSGCSPINITVGASTYALNPYFIFRKTGGSSGFGHNESGGAFLWPGHQDETGAAITTATQEDWLDTDNGSPSYTEDFYNDGRCTWDSGTVVSGCALGDVAVASVHKGFDPRFAEWKRPNNQIVSQRCGQTWLDTFAQIGVSSNFSATNPPIAVSINTWNDYEEGTALEPGIDNCYTLNTPTVTSHVLNWVLNNGGDTYAQTRTISRFRVWISDATGEFLQLLQDNLANTATSLPLDTYCIPSGTWKLYVQMIGKPLIINRMSPTVAYAGGVCASQRRNSIRF